MRVFSPSRPSDATPPAPGAWLHLDVSQGCTGALLCAALLDLGAPEQALRDALDQAGLGDVRPRWNKQMSGSLRGTALDWAEKPAAQERAERGAGVLASDVLAALGECALPPLPKALAHRALRRALDALARLRGVPLESLDLPAPLARELRIEVVAGAGLLQALSPARVSASAVGVCSAPLRFFGEPMPGPSPWILAILEGARVVEGALAPEAISPGGAALLWSVAHRIGARDEWRVGTLGIGLGTAPASAGTSAAGTPRCHAHYGPAPSLATRAGEESSQRHARVHAHLAADADLGALMDALGRVGATACAWHPAQGPGGEALCLLSCAVPVSSLDEGIEVLVRMGSASEVLASEVEHHSVGVRLTTVRVGGRNRAHALRIREQLFRGELLAAEPLADDVREAARMLGWPPARVRAEALGAWASLTHAPAGDEQA